MATSSTQVSLKAWAESVESDSSTVPSHQVSSFLALCQRELAANKEGSGNESQVHLSACVAVALLLLHSKGGADGAVELLVKNLDLFASTLQTAHQLDLGQVRTLLSSLSSLLLSDVLSTDQKGRTSQLVCSMIASCFTDAPPKSLQAAISDPELPLPLLPKDASAVLSVIASEFAKREGGLHVFEVEVAARILKTAAVGGNVVFDPGTLIGLYTAAMRELQDILSSLSAFNQPNNNHAAAKFPSQAALTATAELASHSAVLLNSHGGDKDSVLAETFEELHSVSDALLSYIIPLAEGQQARLALLSRLLPVLASMHDLQLAAGQATSMATLQKVAVLSRAQLVRIALIPSVRQPWLGISRWSPKTRVSPSTEQEAAMTALRVALGNFAGFLAAAWGAGHQNLVESSLVALLSNAFTVEPAVEAGSAPQEQQATLMLVDEVMALRPDDVDLAHLLIPMLLVKELRDATAPVKATAALVLGHFGSSCAQAGNRWGYERSADLLIRLYKEPAHPLPSILMWQGQHAQHAASIDNGVSPEPAHVGALGDSLAVLASGAACGEAEIRQDCCTRLLTLFLDMAFVIGPTARENELRDLGSLLQPLSVACAASRADSANRNSPEDTKALLLAWLYIAVHGFAAPPGSRNAHTWPPPFREAAGRLAAEGTPAAVLGGGDDLLTANISAELELRLNKLGSKGMAPSLASALLRLLGQSSGSAVPAGNPAVAAQMLATAAANIARVTCGPLPSAKDPQPLDTLLNGLKGVDPAGWHARVLENIVDASLNCYIRRLQSQTTTMDDTPDSRQGAAESLGVSLIHSVTTGTERTQSLSGRLLGQLLDTFTGLKWSKRLLKALYFSLGNLSDSDDSLHASLKAALTARLKEVIYKGAVHAPGHTEALLQELFLAGQESPAGYAPGLSADLTASLAAGRATFPMASLLQSHSSTLTVTRKAHIAGLISGAMGAAGSLWAGQAAGHGRLQRQLAHDLTQAGPSLDESAFSNRCFRAAAALIATAGRQSGGQQELLQALCRCCTEPLRLDRLRVTLVSWHWVAAAAPSLQVAVVSEVAAEWLKTANAKTGLFYTSFNASTFRNSTGRLPDHSAMTNAIACHHLWLSFFLEAWQIATEQIGSAREAMLNALQALIQGSLANSEALSQHPASVGARFRLLLLGLQHARHLQETGKRERAAALHESVLMSALMWFSNPVAYFGGWTAEEAREQAAAVDDFASLLEACVHTWPVPGGSRQPSQPGSSGQVPLKDRLALLRLLLEDERDRLHVWATPLETGARRSITVRESSLVAAAWATHPKLALALLDRFPAEAALRQQVEALVAGAAAQARLQELPEAAALLATPAAAKSGDGALSNLKDWAPAPLLQALVMMGGPAGQAEPVCTYALRSLRACAPEQVAFFLPQLVQQLRRDEGHLIRDFLLDAALRSKIFAHNLVCTLRSEAKPSPEAFSPAVKRSGWQPPQDTGLWDIAGQVQNQVFEQMPAELLEFLKAELDFFDSVTDISGALYPVPKDERKAGAVKLARELKLPRDDLYLPTSPHYRVKGVIPESATPMQSAAKVPILVAFQVEDTERPEEGEKVQACIFKVGDDCRQDVLALQVVGLLKDALSKAGLPLYLAPYGVLPTAYECGIIEVVPNCNSRSGLGETADGGLYEIFRREFGAPGTPRFEAARQNFIASEAGYAIACYLLQAKDRHNGNILIDVAGHLVHIDFGFILEISPGGNMRFESAAFKLSHEMTLLIDPGGSRASREFRHFEDLCVRGFLAARGVAEGIIATVALMAESGLPCYGRGRPVENLRKRFHLEKSDSQAAAFMRTTIRDAYDKWTTGFYDYVQYLQNAIPK